MVVGALMWLVAMMVWVEGAIDSPRGGKSPSCCCCGENAAAIPPPPPSLSFLSCSRLCVMRYSNASPGPTSMAIPTRKTSKTATSQGKMEKNKGEVRATPRTPAEPCPFVTRSWRVWRLVIREDGWLLLLWVVLGCVCVCARCCCVWVLVSDDDDDDDDLDDAAAGGAAGVDEEELSVPTLIYCLY